MQIDLTVTNKSSGASSSSALNIEDRVVLGRDLNSPVQLEGAGLSREHFSLTLTNDQLFVEDLSSNGTWLNGEPLPSRTAVQAQHGDLIEILGYSIQIGLPQLQAVPSEPSLPTTTPKRAWKAVVGTAVHFFSPLEIVLILSAGFTFALISYCVSL
jgi:pSer/pThr/pTyr-binding forkhead associated (FHA) protein